MTFVIAAIGATGASCGGQSAPASPPIKSIGIDREVVLNDLLGTKARIAQNADGGFIVTGGYGTGWAVATDPNGKVLWQYQDPRDPQSQENYQSMFNGAVPLDDRRVLLCGENTAHGSIGQLTIMDAHGALTERRAILPVDARHFTYSNIGRCFPWNGGIGVIGGASNGRDGAPWLMRLDKHGTQQWLIFLVDMVANNPLELSDHSLVLSSPGNTQLEEDLVRVNEKGVTQARRTLKAAGYLQLRDLELTNSAKGLAYSVNHQSTLYDLDEKLEDANKPRPIGAFSGEHGCGYVLADGSLAIFGRTKDAAIAWISPSGDRTATLEFPHASDSVDDAIPISRNQFVTVRMGVSPNEFRGLIITWITLNGA